MKDGKPIVLMIHSLPRGGAERLVVDQANELYRIGEEVYVVTLGKEKSNSLLSECVLPKDHVLLIPVRGLFDIRGIGRLVSFLRKSAPRAVCTHLWFANTLGRIAATIARVPCRIAFEHNVYDTLKRKKQFFVDYLLAKISSHIVAVSSAVKNSLVRHGIAERRITVIYNGIPLGRFGVGEHASTMSGPIQFLCVGRLTRQKGMDILIRALARTPGCTLSIVGEGEDERELRSLAESVGVSERVSFLGVRSDIPERMRAADCFVLASRWEGLGIVLIEALASGLPVITTTVGGIPEIIRDGIHGILIPPEDEESLSRALGRFVNEPELRARLRIAGPSQAKKFSITENVSKLLSLITTCV